MNRYPIWKYVLMALAFTLGLLYTLPNFFGEAPAVQVSPGKATVKFGSDMPERIRQALSQAGVQERGMFVENHSIRVRLADTDQQLKAKDALQRSLNPDAADPGYVVALNLLSASPRWLSQLRALPMYLGLDLRGGVHFLLQVDLKQAAIKRYDAMAGDARSLLRDKAIRHAGISREGETIRVNFRDAETRIKSLTVLRESLTDVDWTESGEGDALALSGKLKPEAEKRAMENALKQNIITLNNRINELGVAEPIIAQQGSERVVVQLPGVQDTAKAKDILGRTATLEIRMVCDAPEEISALSAGTVPFGCERYLERGSAPVSVRKQVILTGDNLTDAQAGFDSNSQEPAVHLSLDAKGARIFRDITRENVGSGRVQISGRMTTEEANDVALLLRAGSLAAPMEIIEERTIGPSLGAENISKGFHSTIWGFVAVTAFMALYYMLFGVISSLALATNLLLLIAVLSLLQATLTLPGIAAIALTLGMAIDANVLINERIREELRNGASPQAAISAGYDRAWDTILDSNITTLIAGIALLVFGSGPVRGFAVVHCLGILTSMFSAVFFSRGLVAAWYGSRRKLAKLSIG
ncbi:MAG: protein translocase subunit SecD [Betaproteobacteria bacterium]|nr:protein translocase subunit SecD [Betaproteobacteria bacterium]